MNDHCKDCCCAQVWRALGITTYTGKSLVEHVEELKAQARPAKKAKRKAVLKNWRVRTGSNGIWPVLTGDVYGHPKFQDGEAVVTSPVLRLDIPGGMAETMHTVYLLGDRR
jgi:hypothetical protein